ncbi:MAG: DNA polymerase/3'-5' exonuclease PolX [Phycisphaerae bacterium]
MSRNHELAELFERMAEAVEVQGGNRFKAAAFARVGRVLEGLLEDVEKLVAEDRLEKVEGIGKSSAQVIRQYVAEGRADEADEVLAGVPEGVLAMMGIPGLGPKWAGRLWKEAGVQSVAELKAKLDAGGLATIKGLGEKKLQQMREGIELIERAGERTGLLPALMAGEALLEAVRTIPGVKRAELAGSLRRRRETIGDLDILCCPSADGGEGVEDIGKAFASLPDVEEVIAAGTTKTSVRLRAGPQADLRVVPEANFGSALLYFTGSKDHNVKLRGMANDRGQTLNEWGLYDRAAFEKAKKEPGRPPELKAVASDSEEAVYEALGLAWVPPELREDAGEVEAAAAGKLPRLIELSDIRGDLHTHTRASDGRGTIEEMALAAKAMGYAYYGFADHSKSQVQASGLDEKRLLKHIEAIRNAAAGIKGIELLVSCEVDILVDGQLDFPDDVLKELDYVVASPHVSLKQAPAKATDRLLRAIDNRYVSIIGHPTGRLVGTRAGLEPDMHKLFERAAAGGTALEINAGWPRLDLRDRHARAAVEAGCMLSINTDAHSVEGLSGMRLGIAVARRAWVEPARVINTFTTKKLRDFFAAKR